MKAVIAAGGHGSRLRPVTWTLNKHLIPMAGEPLLFNAIKKIAEVGITEIAINVNPGEKQIQTACGDGSRWGVALTYIEQSGGPVGIGQIVANAKEFVGNDDVLFYLGDNVILGSLQPFVEKFRSEELDCCLAFSEVREPQRFGVAQYDAAGTLVGIVEKPEVPPSHHAVTGIYLYKMPAYLEAFGHIRREDSTRNEFEISHVHDWLIKQGRKVGYMVVTGWWKDTGTPDDLLEGNQLLLDEMTIEAATIAPDAQIDASAQIQGRVRIGTGAIIGPQTLLRGPLVIGEGAQLEHCYVGPHTSIGAKTVIRHAQIEHSIVMDETVIDTDASVVDSIIGHKARLTDAKDQLPVGKRMIIGENSQVAL